MVHRKPHGGLLCHNTSMSSKIFSEQLNLRYISKDEAREFLTFAPNTEANILIKENISEHGIFRAVESGIITKTEARELLGFEGPTPELKDKMSRLLGPQTDRSEADMTEQGSEFLGMRESGMESVDRGSL